MNNLAWHYTTGEKFYLIIDSGKLQPTSIGVTLPEKPILWFSKNQLWEQTANKIQFKNGILRVLSMEETESLGGGLVRFGICVDRLHHWRKLIKKARMALDMARSLEAEAKNSGAHPNEWYGVTYSIPLSQIKSIQVLENGAWVEVKKETKLN